MADLAGDASAPGPGALSCASCCSHALQEGHRILEISYVEYDTRVGAASLFMAVGALVPQMILVSLLTLCILGAGDRRKNAAVILGGLFFNQIVNHFLKQWVKQPRPLHGTQVKSDYGWPSSHAQFMAFFSTLMLLILWKGLHRRRWPMLWTYLLLLVAVVAWVTTSRVLFGFHTASQVIAGVCFGPPVALSFNYLMTEGAHLLQKTLRLRI